MLEQIRERVRKLSPAQQGVLWQRVRQLNQDQATAGWSPLTPLQTNPGGQPVYFIHPMGSALFFYLPLLKYLSLQTNVYGIQGHGLVEGQTAMDSIPAMASYYIETLQHQQPTGPYHLVGYSMGGLIAFEMAQQLRAAKAEVGFLGILDSYAFTKRIPFPGQEIEDDDERLMMHVATSLEPAQLKQLRRVLQPLMPYAEQLDHIIQVAKQTGRVPANYTVADLRRMFNAYDAHLTAVETYRPQPYTGQLFFYQCQDTSDTRSLPSIPWKNLAPYGLVHRKVAGKHSNLMSEPQVQGVARELRQVWRQMGIE